jgi:inorganic pyrophosphatase
MKPRLPCILFTCCSALLFLSCTPLRGINKISAFASETTVNCVIEIPAGTNKKIEFNKNTKRFEIDKIKGVDRIKQYLPYPANYGFIPSTNSNKDKGGDGDPIDVMLLCESVPTGSVIEAYPIAMLRLVDEGERDYKVLCIPKNPTLQVVKAKDISDLEENHPKILEILQLWFQHSDPSDTILMNGWEDTHETIAEIKKLATFYKEANFTN